MTFPSLKNEKELWEKGYLVIGVDEVGRGAFAGPLFAAGVIFNPKSNLKKLLSYGINDSKKLTAAKRESISKVIKKEALAYYISPIGVAEINRIGIGKANYKAIRNVVSNLLLTIKKRSSTTKPFLLIDGFRIKNIKGIGLASQKKIIHGDEISLSIAAASILAKVARDEYMRNLSEQYSEFDWKQNKGYGTLAHRNALTKYGATPFHRTDFIENFI